jgi:hypothetical protein
MYSATVENLRIVLCHKHVCNVLGRYFKFTIVKYTNLQTDLKMVTTEKNFSLFRPRTTPPGFVLFELVKTERYEDDL